jgi:hypothetical protein
MRCKGTVFRPMYHTDDSQFDSHVLCSVSSTTFLLTRNGRTIVHFWHLMTLHREAMWQLCQGMAFPLRTPNVVVPDHVPWQWSDCSNTAEWETNFRLCLIYQHDTGLIILLAFRLHQMLNFTPQCPISGTKLGCSVLQCLFSVFMCTFK